MGKLFWLLLLIAAFTGIYWAVMSGWAAERALAFDINAAAREQDPATIADALTKCEGRLDSEKQWVGYFKFIMRKPDWSRIEDSRKTLHELQAAAQEAVNTSGGEIGSEATEKLRKYLNNMAPLRVGVFREGQDTLWKVLFWVSGCAAVLVGLLVFVRRSAD